MTDLNTEGTGVTTSAPVQFTTGQVSWSPTYTVVPGHAWWSVLPPPDYPLQMNPGQVFTLAAVPPAVEVEPDDADDINGVDPPGDTEEEMVAWEGVLGFEGVPTDDRRYLIPGGIDERALPMTLMAQTVTDDGHDGAQVCGRIDRIWRLAMPTIGPRAVAIMGSGVFDDAEIARLVDEQFLRGVSFDLATKTVVPIDPETYEELDTEDPATLDRIMSGDALMGITGTIMGATICPFPAFANANVHVISKERVLVASAGAITLVKSALTASAAGIAPLTPPQHWFYMQEPNELTPLTVTPDGQVYGHLASWDQCHVGFPRSCQLAPRSRSNYKWFHLGAIRTHEGTDVPVGRLTVGAKGHAPLGLDSNGAMEHYDQTGTVGAFVRATDGRLGIWICGAVRSDCPAEKVRDMMANPPSGDWRLEQGGLELVAALSVPKPGFPIPRAEYAMVASASGEETITALFATTPVTAPLSRAEQRQRTLLARKIRAALSA
jgi:hypothetical protein